MAEGQGGQGGGQGYTDDDIELLLNETAKRAAIEALKSQQSQPQPQPRERHREDEENGDELIGVSPKLVKQLQGTVTVFNTLKEFASNPLQKAIETKVGELAAGVIENAFTRPSGPPPKRDLIETILNSQFAFGLGNGLGQRGPELVESMGKTFGRDKAGEMIDGIIGQYGKGQGGQTSQSGGSRQLDTGPSPGPSSPVPEQKQQTEKELLLSLDPNNPEHVAAYAESQGGISVDVARKMLMIHQDEFIKQMKSQGADVSQLSTMRGSHTERPSQTPSATSQQGSLRSEQPESPTRHTDYVSPRQPVQQPVQSPQEYPSEMEYAEFQDVSSSPYPTPPGIQYPGNPPPGVGIPSGGVSPPGTNTHPEANSPVQDQQVEIIKQFANDIGKVMGDMVNKVEALNNTVFVLQNEMNEMKRKGVSVTPTAPIVPMVPVGGPSQPDIPIPSDIPEEIVVPSDVPEDTIMPEEEIRTVPKYPKIRRSEDFFEESIHDANDFLRELEEESKTEAKKFKELTKEKLDGEENGILSPPIPIEQPQPPVQPVSVQSLAHPAPEQLPTQPIPTQSPEQYTPVPVIRQVPSPMIKPSVTVSKPITAMSQPIDTLNQAQTAPEKQEDVVPEKQEEEEYKKFVRPIKTAGLHKKIYTPSFKSSNQLEKGKDNKDADNIKEA